MSWRVLPTALHCGRGCWWPGCTGSIATARSGWQGRTSHRPSEFRGARMNTKPANNRACRCTPLKRQRTRREDTSRATGLKSSIPSLVPAHTRNTCRPVASKSRAQLHKIFKLCLFCEFFAIHRRPLPVGVDQEAGTDRELVPKIVARVDSLCVTSALQNWSSLHQKQPHHRRQNRQQDREAIYHIPEKARHLHSGGFGDRADHEIRPVADIGHRSHKD